MTIIRFPLTLRPPGPAPRFPDSDVVVFPFSARRHLVERHARAMRALGYDEGEAYLERVLNQLCADLDAMGIDCVDCRNDAIYEFAIAIGKELHGADFVLKIEGGT